MGSVHVRSRMSAPANANPYTAERKSRQMIDEVIPPRTTPDETFGSVAELEPELLIESELSKDPKYWSTVLREYARPSLLPSLWFILTSVVAYFAVSVGMYFAMRVSPWLTLALAPVSACFLLRSFIVFHDCTHNSFFGSRKANLWMGTFTGVLVMAPFTRWRHDHNVHHASAGDLDKRGVGDLPTMTVAEYWSKPAGERRAYRAFRNPAVMFGIGPIVAMIVGPRIPSKGAPKRFRDSVLVTDAMIAVAMAAAIVFMGFVPFVLVWTPAALLAGSAGIWLFYVQHQFEDTYWERGGDWTYADAGLRGSSFLNLPQPLRFASGNIGYHHIHHLSAKIPCYQLPQAHDQNEVFHSVPVLTFRDGLRATRLKLWDETSGRLITWAEADLLRPDTVG